MNIRAQTKVAPEHWRLLPRGPLRPRRPLVDLKIIELAHDVSLQCGRGFPWNKRRKPKYGGKQHWKEKHAFMQSLLGKRVRVTVEVVE